MKRYGMGVVLAAVLVPAVACAVQVTFRNNVHTSLGAATLTLAGDSLRVGNLGSSGNDGVSIAVPNTGGFHMDYNAYVLPPTGVLSVFALATGDTLSETRISVENGAKVLDVALEALPGITHYRVDAYLAGVVVASRDVLVTPPPVTSRGVPDEMNICIRCFIKRVADWLDDHNTCVLKDSVKIIVGPNGELKTVNTVGVDFKLATIGRIGGDPTPVTFDDLHVYPIGATVDSRRADHIVILGKDHPGLVIRQENTLIAAPIGERSFWILCSIGIAVLGATRLYLVRGRRRATGSPLSA